MSEGVAQNVFSKVMLRTSVGWRCWGRMLEGDVGEVRWKMMGTCGGKGCWERVVEKRMLGTCSGKECWERMMEIRMLGTYDGDKDVGNV